MAAEHELRYFECFLTCFSFSFTVGCWRQRQCVCSGVVSGVNQQSDWLDGILLPNYILCAQLGEKLLWPGMLSSQVACCWLWHCVSFLFFLPALSSFFISGSSYKGSTNVYMCNICSSFWQQSINRGEVELHRSSGSLPRNKASSSSCCFQLIYGCNKK